MPAAIGRGKLHRQRKRHMQGSTCLLFLAITQTDPHCYSSASSTNRASVLPVNKVPPPLSSSAIEDMVSVLGISSVGYSGRMVMSSCGLAESASFAGSRENLSPALFWELQVINKSRFQKTGVIYMLFLCNPFEPRREGDVCLYAFIVTLCPV